MNPAVTLPKSSSPPSTNLEGTLSTTMSVYDQTQTTRESPFPLPNNNHIDQPAQPQAVAAASSTMGQKIDTDENWKDDSENRLTEHRKTIVKTSWRAIQFALNEEATKVFYKRLFEEYPSVRPMFKDDMASQYKKLYDAVSLAVKCLDDLETLVPVLQDLGRRHAKWGVVRDHYEAVVDCFLWTLNTFIFTHMPATNAIKYAFDVADAWEWALLLIGTTMADAADEGAAEQEAAASTTTA